MCMMIFSPGCAQLGAVTRVRVAPVLAEVDEVRNHTDPVRRDVEMLDGFLAQVLGHGRQAVRSLDRELRDALVRRS